jgi:hypothetical protein
MRTFDEFWPFYLREHSKSANRRLHFIGTTLAICFLLGAIFQARPWYFLFAMLSGYAFAWVGHFFVEHNRPATFKYPLWSLGADFRMWLYSLTGRLPAELQRAGVQ